jgi:hypothetical protein
MSRRHNNNNGGNTPNDVKEFANASLKKHKKEYGDYFDSKKALKKDYFDSLIAVLPATIDWLLKNGHKTNVPQIAETKNACYDKFAGELGPDFIKYLTKFVDKFGVEEIENIEYFPIILFEIISDIQKYNAEHATDEENQYEEPTELYELANVILKKRMKKAKKRNIPENVAFDLLANMPTKDSAKYGGYSRVRGVFDVLYHYGAELTVPFDTTIEFLFDEGDYKYVIGYALQERKDRYKSFNETQKKLFNDITSWVFLTMEGMSKSEIREILENYIRVRRRDDGQGKDSNRRYYLSSLPESDYPKIVRCVNDLILANDENKKYL